MVSTILLYIHVPSHIMINVSRYIKFNNQCFSDNLREFGIGTRAEYRPQIGPKMLNIKFSFSNIPGQQNQMNEYNSIVSNTDCSHFSFQLSLSDSVTYINRPRITSPCCKHPVNVSIKKIADSRKKSAFFILQLSILIYTDNLF